MSKEKTVMKILIDGLESRYKDIEHSHNPYHYETRGMLMELIHEAKYLLQKEQEQIEKAFDDGYDEASIGGGEYYQSKYGGEDVDR